MQSPVRLWRQLRALGGIALIWRAIRRMHKHPHLKAGALEFCLIDLRPDDTANPLGLSDYLRPAVERLSLYVEADVYPTLNKEVAYLVHFPDFARQGGILAGRCRAYMGDLTSPDWAGAPLFEIEVLGACAVRQAVEADPALRRNIPALQATALDRQLEALRRLDGTEEWQEYFQNLRDQPVAPSRLISACS